MIRRLQIDGLKRFDGQGVEFAPLTVLTGLNGSGKTTVIHALLLMREGLLATGNPPAVRLNGPYGLELGTFESIQNWGSLGDIKLAVERDSSDAEVLLSGRGNALHAEVKSRSGDPVEFGDASFSFQYLAAERQGPRLLTGSNAQPDDRLQVGAQGEYSAQVLHTLDAQQVKLPQRRFDPTDDAAATSVRYETERWLSRIARPTEIKTEAMIATGAYSILFRIPGEEWVRATNMGFGVTYALPVVLAGLLAAKDGILIVENPEAHLHPAGQSAVGGFLAKVAATGTQVIVETHSDHVLNGIRLAVARDKTILPEEVTVQFFDAKQPGATRLNIDALGGLSSWPAGFFDQFHTDVASLTRVRRPR